MLSSPASTQTRPRTNDSALTLRILRSIWLPTLGLIAAGTSIHLLLPAASSQGLFSVPGVALVGSVIFEAVAVWFLIWMSLAWTAAFSAVNPAMRGVLQSAIRAYGPSSAKRIAHRAIGAAAVAGTALAGVTGAAGATDLNNDDILWPGTAASEALVAVSDVDDLWFPPEPEEPQPSATIATVDPAQDVTTAVEAKPGTDVFAQETTVPQVPSPTLAKSEVNPIQPPLAVGSPDATLHEHRLPSEFEQSSIRRAQNVNTPRNLGTGSIRDLDLSRISPVQLAKARIEAQLVSAPSPSVETHLVQPGDCLWTIAAQILGESVSNWHIDTLWQEIYRLNAATIGVNPNQIEPGQVLVLPTIENAFAGVEMEKAA